MVQHKAVIKNVLSGDTVILRGKPRANGPPAERLLALSNVQAPRLGNTTRDDEPFAFGAREYMRKMLVGKEVTFVPEYTVSTVNPPREYGSILLANGDNVAHLGVQQGWLKVREGKARSNQDDEAQEQELNGLRLLEQEARDTGKGQWSASDDGVRQVSYSLNQDPRTFLNAYKGKALDAIIEQVRDASTLRVLLILPDQTQQVVTLFLSGIKAPACKRDNAPDQANNTSEPFGEEAKVFVETRLLQRGVKVVLEGVGQGAQNNFVGSVQHPAGSIAELLLSNGLAKCQDWSITLVTGGPQALRKAETAAKVKNLRVWKDFVAKARANDSEFDAQVIKIVTGDTIVVKTADGVERKLQLSSVKQAPKQAGSVNPNGKSRDMKEVGYQFEAREFLRKKLIGKQVHVVMDYKKPAQDGFEAKDCATIKLGNVNIAQQLIEKGLATPIRHRKDDDNRSHCYDHLMLAETKAQEQQKGVHSSKDHPIVRIVDASENMTKARQFLSSLKRSPRQHAVVEHVANGSRLFLWVPKENCRLSFVLAGVRAPRVGRSTNDKSEPFGPEALAHAQDLCLQHDVEIEIDNVDKTGAFIGNVFVNDKNLAIELLEQGLVYVHEYSANESRYANQFFAAERNAKTSHAGLWKEYNDEQPKQDLAQQQAASAQQPAQPRHEYIDVVVSDMISGSHFYVQLIHPAEIKQLESLMKDLSLHYNARPATGSDQPKPRVGDVVSAKFTEDDCWYRAKVRRVSSDGIEVLYIDYGNSEVLPRSRIQPLASQFKTLKPQAQEAMLSFVRCPGKDAEYGVDCMERFHELTAGRQLVANVDAKENGVLCLTLYDPKVSTNAEASINLEMVRDGAGLVNTKASYAAAYRDILRSLQDAQAAAQRERLGMFVYGDIDEDAF
ncbi:hypothetical protein DM01DRAFT_1308746 [Hesseltinella vesiculosa]|uniref:Transcription factor n=1 Tax=Hesseltinella vesiculosa TaxID=101127 RepID=A0A1X2GBJ9_9FUNG|nr:hypothetical protein DM01DRAFT_1308746 [Hesseltinella vesiculosa]